MIWFFAIWFGTIQVGAQGNGVAVQSAPANEVHSAAVVASAPANAKKFQIKVLQASGDINDLSSAAKPGQWTIRSKVADRLILHLPSGAETKIQLHPHVVVTIFGPADFEVPVISWETRHFQTMKLNRGALRLQVGEKATPFDLETPFYTVQAPVGLGVFEIDPGQAQAHIVLLKGKLEVTPLNSEEKVSLQSGQRVTFRGALEEGEVAYDLLLQGRKVPRGQWLPIEKMRPVDFQKYSLEAEQKRIENAAKSRAKAQQAEQKRHASDICTKPYGDFGDCLWKKQNKDCIRTRCAADGQWKDPQVVPASFCTKAGNWSAVPKKCDY